MNREELFDQIEEVAKGFRAADMALSVSIGNPISNEELLGVDAALGFSLPNLLRNFYRAMNGLHLHGPADGEAVVNYIYFPPANELAGHFQSLRAALIDQYADRERIAKPPNYLPCAFITFDLIVVRQSGDEADAPVYLYDVWNLDEKWQVVAPNLEQWIYQTLRYAASSLVFRSALF